ncbi:MAG: hypothetical protein LQ350_002057 [Teloschistes chrysophthalmus]|nr:MAG: hypothetical protein LQ350_002057 [Niorma chrysophthalma]
MALQDYWGPLLAFAAVSTIVQSATLGYCIRVYIRSLFKDDSRSQNSSGLPSHNGSIKTVTAKQAYRRVQKAVAVQWRGIVVVIIIIVNVVFLAVVFVSMDNTEQAVMQNFGKAEPWLTCLVINRGDKDACLDKVNGLATSEPTVMAVLILMSVSENPSHIMKRTDRVLMWTFFKAQWHLDPPLPRPIFHDSCVDRIDPQAFSTVPSGFRLCGRPAFLSQPSTLRDDDIASTNRILDDEDA